MYPLAEQVLAYAAADEAKRKGGLVLEVKGDFCHQVREFWKGISGPKSTSKSAWTPSIDITPCTTISKPTRWPTASRPA